MNIPQVEIISATKVAISAAAQQRAAAATGQAGASYFYYVLMAEYVPGASKRRLDLNVIPETFFPNNKEGKLACDILEDAIKDLPSYDPAKGVIANADNIPSADRISYNLKDLDDKVLIDGIIIDVPIEQCYPGLIGHIAPDPKLNRKGGYVRSVKGLLQGKPAVLHPVTGAQLVPATYKDVRSVIDARVSTPTAKKENALIRLVPLDSVGATMDMAADATGTTPGADVTPPPTI